VISPATREGGDITLWTDFSTADILLCIGIGVNLYYTMKLIDGLDRRTKVLEEKLGDLARDG
jgi:hypothetical protein